MTLTWAGWLFLISAWGTIGGLTGYCMRKVLLSSEKKHESSEENPVVITP